MVSKSKKPSLSAEEAKFWSTSYPVNGYAALLKLVKDNRATNPFEKVKCPVFVGYYYKNEQEQDKVVSVPTILKMHRELRMSNKEKDKVTFSEVGNHVIACHVKSRDWQSVFDATTLF
jgi:hypothetical protein